MLIQLSSCQINEIITEKRAQAVISSKANVSSSLFFKIILLIEHMKTNLGNYQGKDL